MNKIYDLIILGGGPASMSAAVYASQMKLDTILIERGPFGGQVATTSEVTNYLGFPSITGEELSNRMREHLESTDVNIITAEIVSTILDGDIKVVKTFEGEYKAKTVIIGIGTAVRKLSVENENKFIGQGISYTTLKDRDKYEDKVVAVVGGGNSAIEDAMYLSEKARKVYLIHRRDEFRADQKLVNDLQEKINLENKIELVLSSKPHSIEGENFVTALNVTYIPTDTIRRIELDGIFVAIGRGASTDIIDEKIERDPSGYIVTNEIMETNLPGVYAIGDIRDTPLRQIVTATSDGAIAAVTAYNFVKKSRMN